MHPRAAQALSVVFHPVFVNSFSLLLLFLLFPSLRYGVHPAMKVFYWSVIFISTGIVPMAWVGVSRLLGKIDSILLPNSDDRNLPYILTASLYMLDFYLAGQWGASSLFRAYLLACSSVVVSVLIINQFTKISIHAASLGALAAVIHQSALVAGFDVRYLMIAALVISGLVLSARLWAESHTSTQVYLGFLVGFLWMVLML
ncbi:MAG: hypothetical protein WC760_12675 [Bacteroidia bacterium]|jgi:hypothetical protein